jgi:N-acetylglucosaminyldiphosphoundecaprenol N-acetyl-beta-D-mannosaminyltransferase
MKMELLGVKINYPFLKKNFDSVLKDMTSSKKTSFIFTVNPEFIVDAQHDPLFKSILNQGSFNSVDGIGVVMALEYQESLKETKNKFSSLLVVIDKYFKGQIIKKRFTGVEISERIFEFSNKNYCNVFLLGGDKFKMVSENLLIDLQKKYPNINFIGASSSFVSKPNDDIVTIEFIEDCMKRKGVREIDFVLVGYGHPFQEKWILRNFSKFNAKVFVGVGGTFDFLSGNILRAPKFLQKLGLEWLFRLLIQPARYKRIFKAVGTFSYLIFRKINY